MDKANANGNEAKLQDFMGDILGDETAHELFSSLQNASKQELLTLQESLHDLFRLLQQNANEPLPHVV
jgi:hypothetical protein